MSFAQAIQSATPRPNFNVEWALGNFLRFDIPLIEKQDRQILYTDTDVIFCCDPRISDIGGVIGACSEYIVDESGVAESTAAFNAGVMVLDVHALRGIHHLLVEYTIADDCARGAQGWYDQGVLNQVFRGRWTVLPQSLNWRPYAGCALQPEIIHFQRFKPHQMLSMRSGGSESPVVASGELHHAAKAEFARALAAFEAQFPPPARHVWNQFARERGAGNRSFHSW
ncbi:hypothetical protein JNW90_17900 [Micromonospora sp. STR1s_5]|nr:hypothetical protein [Micromonospora sp. STR1s_5]